MAFPGARSIAIIERTLENKKRGGQSHEQVAYISSLVDPPPELFLAISRSHWAIENSLHYVKDVTYQEDRHPMYKANGHLNMTLLRSCAISIANLLSAASLPSAIGSFKKHKDTVLNCFKVTHRLAGI